MKIGVSSYSFTSYVKATGKGFRDICDLAKSMGYDGIEFVGFDEPYALQGDPLATARDLRDYCASIGLEITAYAVGGDFLHQDPQAQVKRLRACVDVAAELGVSAMRHDVAGTPRDLPRYTYRDAVAEIAPYIRQVTEYAAAKGVRTCTENHGRFLQDPARMEALIRTVDHPNYGWLLDMGNFLVVDADPVEGAVTAAPYVFHVHAKDFVRKPFSPALLAQGSWGATRRGDLFRGTIVGHGVVPIPEVVHVLRSAGYDGYLSLEFEGLEDPLTALRDGQAYLRAVAEQAAY